MAHIHEKIDFAVDVFIVYQDKVLLRFHEKYHKWLSVGGHIELDETPTLAALREVREEVGLEVVLFGEILQIGEGSEYEELLPPRFMNIHRISATHQHISLVYYAVATSDKVIPENATDEWKWLTLEELDSMDISEAIRHYAKSALLAVNG